MRHDGMKTSWCRRGFLWSHDTTSRISCGIPLVNSPTVQAFRSTTSFVVLILLFVAFDLDLGIGNVDGFIEGFDEVFGHIHSFYEVHEKRGSTTSLSSRLFLLSLSFPTRSHDGMMT